MNSPSYNRKNDMASFDIDVSEDASEQGFHRVTMGVDAALSSAGALSENQKGIVLASLPDGETCLVYCPRTVHASRPNPCDVLYSKLSNPSDKFSKDYYEYFVRANFSDGASVIKIPKDENFSKQSLAVQEGSLVNIRYNIEHGYPTGGVVTSLVRNAKNAAVVLQTPEEVKAFSSFSDGTVPDSLGAQMPVPYVSTPYTTNPVPSTASKIEKIIRIIGKHESNNNPSAIANRDLTLEFSYGILQANLYAPERENFVELLTRYEAIGGKYASQFKSFKPWTKAHKQRLATDQNFVSLLRKAGRDEKMYDVQVWFFSKFYINPAIAFAKGLGLKFPASHMVVASTFIQYGDKPYVRRVIKRSVGSAPGNERAGVEKIVMWKAKRRGLNRRYRHSLQILREDPNLEKGY